MSKPLHAVICLLALVFINRIECIKLTKENVISLGGVHHNFTNKQINEIDPVALAGINSTTLYLNYNELTYLQEDLLRYNTNFKDLNFHYNKISKIHPLVFQKLPNLNRIYLHINELTEIPASLFERNTKLNTICLHHNKITFFHPNTFKNLTNLGYLYISYNALTSFDWNLLSSSKELKDLHLQNNDLTEIWYLDLKLHFPKLSDVSFNGNKFNCSFAKQVKDYLDKEHIKLYFDSISCISDDEYAIIVSNRGNVTEGLKLQLLEHQSDIEKVKIENEDLKNVTEGLKLQLLEQQAITDKLKSAFESCCQMTFKQ